MEMRPIDEADEAVKPDRDLGGFSVPAEQAINPRQLWATTRFWMETRNMKSRRYGGRGRHHWYVLLFMMKSFELLLKLIGRYRQGKDNAEALVVRDLHLHFPDLPPKFDGFTLLHLSDLHLDGMPDLEQQILAHVGDREADLCVLTGDYRTELHGPISQAMAKIETLVKGIRVRHGFLGVLGNHDDCHMVAPMEAMGIRMLLNESCELPVDGETIQFIGTDDVHYYYTDQALHALESADRAFTVALIHSPELADAAAAAGVDLYLCGHTHHGQVCLPGGVPIITHLNNGRAFYRGQWALQQMQGVTSAGIGTSGIPIRFNTRGEILYIHLHRSASM